MGAKQKISDAVFNFLWAMVSRRPALVVAVGTALAVAAAVCAVLFLRLDANQDNLVSSETPYHKRYLEHIENFGDQEYLFVVIRTGGSDEGRREAERFAESMAGRLKKRKGLIHGVHYKVTMDDLGPGALLFMPLDQAEGLAGAVRSLSPRFRAWMDKPDLPTFFSTVGGLMAQPGQTAGKGADLLGQAFDPLARITGNLNLALDGQPPLKPLLGPEPETTRYFFTKNGRLLIMRVLPVKDFATMDVVGPSLDFTRKCLAQTLAEFPGVQAGLTGRPVLHADEMKTTDKDMTRASIIAVVLVGLLFMLVLHGWLRPVLTIIALAMAISWTFGFAWLTVGRLNLLSIVFALVLVGIGVDFGVHVVMRTLEGRRQGLTGAAAVKGALYGTGPSVVLGALTSVCAFFAVAGSDFVGLAELGIIGGAGIVFCLIAMLTVLPAMLILISGTRLDKGSNPRLTTMPFMEKATSRPKALLAVLAVITIAGIPWLMKAGFSYNLLDLQAKGLSSVEYELALINESDESTWYCIFSAETLEEARQMTERFEALPQVGRVESVLDVLPADQERKQSLFHEAAGDLGPVPGFEPMPAPDAGSLAGALDGFLAGLESVEEKLFASGAGDMAAKTGDVLDNTDDALGVLDKEPAKAGNLESFQNDMARTMLGKLSNLRGLLMARAVTPADLPRSVRDLYVGKDGKFQIKVSPKGNIWDFEALKAFVAELRSIDPLASGTPVGVLESSRLMHGTFISAAGLTLILVSLILWINSLSVRTVLLTLLPLLVGMVWLLELMGALGVSFNLANFFAIPVLIAIGVDGGVHFISRFKHLDKSVGLFSTSTPMAVTLSFATTMIGFGGLLMAHHRGLASLGAVMVLGSATGMVACLLVLPAVLKLVRRES